MKELRVGIVGYKFMGKAHSNAWLKAPLFFDLPFKPVLQAACGRNEKLLSQFAERWGWKHTEADWKALVHRNDVDIVDICLPTSLHREVAVEAARAGKHIFCEKPLATSAADARAMLEAAQKAKVVHYLNHNYRRCPAVRLARRLVDEGRVGRIFHWRGAYLQSWIIDPTFPLTWHLRKETAGWGPHIDLNSHSVDLARYLVGEIKSVMAMSRRFIEERPLPDEAVAGTFKGGAKGKEKGKVTVEDALFMVAEFENGALGSFDTTRFATGRKNYNYFEIYGEKGALAFDFERMNELQYFSSEDPDYAQGFRDILATEGVHDYISNWWPPGHIIGYEHEFVHGVVDFIQAIAKGGQVEPNFLDGLKCLQVLEAGMKSAETGQRVAVSQ
jgi:predicted dehydrogenase